MSKYLIPEINIAKLEAKLKVIEKKCNKYNCNFSYKKLGEQVIKTRIDLGEGASKTVFIKYIEVEVSGTALAESGWQFVAVISHRDEGNVIRQFDTSVEVPQKYFTTSCICEHCNTHRYRTETCLLYNANQNAWKQVGKSCLQEFTGTLTAEHAAMISSFIEQVERAADADMLELSKGPTWLNVATVLKYAGECVRHFGYVRSGEPWATGALTEDLIEGYEFGQRIPTTTEKKIASVDFDAERSENLQQVSDIITWLLDPETADGSSYINNLQTIIKSKFCKINEISIVASAVTAYHRHLRDLEIARERQAAHEKALKSNWIGVIGSRVEIEVSQAYLATTFDTMYGTTFLYKFTTVNDDICTWFASSPIANIERVSKLVGTVKAHTTYEDVKETQLTRCKVTDRRPDPKEVKYIEADTSAVDEAFNMFYAATT